MKSVSVHRFGDRAALAILGQDGETVYLSADQARQVAANLNACADSIAACTFTESSFRAESVKID